MAPDIELFGLTISEPMTTATDYLVTVVGVWLGARLLRSASEFGSSTQLWGAGFLMAGVAAFLGGTSHGFATYLGCNAGFLAWKATVYSIGLSACFALAGAIAGASLGVATRRRFHELNIAAFLVYGIWMINHGSFMYVILYYVPAMIAIAAFSGHACLRTTEPGHRWIIAGVIATMAGAAIQRSRLTLHVHFNHNDLYHVVQVIALCLFYRGVVLSTARQGQARGATTA